MADVLVLRPLRLAGEWSAAAAVSVVCLREFLTEAFVARPAFADRGGYIGLSRLVADGAVLYRDLYDNKPPMIHLLGALAWWVSPDVRSVFQMERIALLLLGGATFAMLRFAFGLRLVPSLAGLVLGLITLRNPEVFSGGHLTEEYGILFLTAAVTCLGLALRAPHGSAHAPWAMAAGACVALTLLTRQTFIASIATIWVMAHAPLVREPRSLGPLLAWQTLGFALPVSAWLIYLWRAHAVGAYLELFTDTLVFGEEASPLGLGGRMAVGLGWMMTLVFDRQALAVVATALAGLLAVAALAARRATGAMPLSPLLVPAWFIAELSAASAPGHFYGHYYLPFVPIWACTFGLAAEALLPRGTSWGLGGVFRVAGCAVLLTIAAVSLDAVHRRVPGRYWRAGLVPTRLPPTVVERLQADAARFGWQRYVPIGSHVGTALLDMPLPLGTRLVSQWRFQFHRPGSPREAELLHDIAAADIVVYHKDRFRLQPTLERRIQELLATSFTPLFEWTSLRFLVRRDRAPGSEARSPG